MPRASMNSGSSARLTAVEIRPLIMLLRTSPTERIMLLKAVVNIMAGAPGASRSTYTFACGQISALAPSSPSSLSGKEISPSPSSTPSSMHHQQQRLEYLFRLSASPAPRVRDISAQPPLPMRLPTAIITVNTGPEMDTAATWASSPVCPTKYISAML